MSPSQDVTVHVNIHELRILGIWAEHYAVSCDNKHLDEAYPESMKSTVVAITRRLEEQLEAMGKPMPLTLSGELKQLKAEFGNVELYRDGKEEVIE